MPLALAADHVVAREDVVLNPYYRHMGGLYGSEYWTYLLPRRIGHELTAELTGAVPAGRDAPRGRDRPARRRFRRDVRASGPSCAASRSGSPAIRTLRTGRAKRRAAPGDEQVKPLCTYRTEELAS